MRTSLAIVLKGYPRLSETFIAQEIRSLEKHGFDITLYSLRKPTDDKTHPIHDEIDANLVYLPEYLYQQPLRVIKSFWKRRADILKSGVVSQWWRDFKRDRTANRIRRLGQAMVLAAELPTHITRVYVHFLHTPASVTQYACEIRQLPWACSAHAKDIWTSPEWELEEKIDKCKWLTTCTQANVEYLQRISQRQDKVKLNYHGLDLDRFPSDQIEFSTRNGGDANQPVILLSVGRAVAKKGYTDLLSALADVPLHLNWKFIHIGGGPLLKSLQTQANALQIASRIEWLGPQSQHTVLQHYQSSDIFILNCQIDEHGDRDGLPNVLVEAQSQGLPVISTAISGVPELVKHTINGLLVKSKDHESLRDGIIQLIVNPELRRQQGFAGSRIVESDFDMNSNHRALHHLLEKL
ncbi:MAG: glycosyltransferase [Gammaproteobacteria bacterium]|nr:glycosyltransferase [Gammaproteobacteria bacterium]